MRVPYVLGPVVLAAALSAPVRTQPAMQEWPVYGGDAGGAKFSPLADINRTNVSALVTAWEWRPEDKPLDEFGTRPGNFQNTPLMIDNVLYVSTPYNRVVALDAESGRQKWSFDPRAYADGQPPNGTGFVHRGLAAWRDPSTALGASSGKLRIFLNSRYRLICLDAETGTPVATFGEKGVVDLSQGLIWPIERTHYTNTSPPVVYKDLVILGNGVGDRLVYKNDPPGDIRAFHARTGKQVWSFHTIPQRGEPGHETWQEGSTRVTGHTNAWAPMTLDVERGLLYAPVGTPSNDFYGGTRKGAGLYGESLLCLDAATGKRKWHFQIAHHGIWDYDPASPPNLVTITVNGKRIDAVVQLTKQGFAFVFDRVTGTPVWPIGERTVPASDVPGEESWPTQPVPTAPPPFSEQGMTLDDAFDLTPELKMQAQAALRTFRLGPLYTPPSMEGTVMRPGTIGGANWGGATFDAQSGRLVFKTTNGASIARIVRPDRSPANPRASEVDAELTGDLSAATTFVPEGKDAVGRPLPPLPLLKPPYGHVVAIDLNRGAIAWRVPFGDNPQLRSHPALRNVALPDQLGAAGAAGVLGTAGGLVFVGGNDIAFHALDLATGRELWRLPLPRRVTGTPMTYRSRAGVQYVLVSTSAGADASLMAFALPGASDRQLAVSVVTARPSKPTSHGQSNRSGWRGKFPATSAAIRRSGSNRLGSATPASPDPRRASAGQASPPCCSRRLIPPKQIKSSRLRRLGPCIFKAALHLNSRFSQQSFVRRSGPSEPRAADGNCSIPLAQLLIEQMAVIADAVPCFQTRTSLCWCRMRPPIGNVGMLEVSNDQTTDRPGSRIVARRGGCVKRRLCRKR